MPALKLRLPPVPLAAVLFTLAGAALAAKGGGLDVKFSDCTEFVGVAPVAQDAARALVPARYQLVTVPTPLLANWWVLDGSKETKMATTLPLILFDFASEVSFTTSRQNLIGRLLQANQIARFPLSFRGAFAAGTMQVKRAP